MKSILLAFCLASAGISSAFSQTSPAPSAKGPAPESATLTPEERTRAIDYLSQTRKDFLASVDGVSDAQWKFKAAPDRWSIAETAEHITVAEQMIWDLISGKIMKSPAAPEKRAEAKGKEEKILAAIPDRSHKAQAPESLKPTGRWANRAALAKEFESIRAKEIAYVTDTKEDLRSHFEENPVLKTMDAWQWLLFNGAHWFTLGEGPEDDRYLRRYFPGKGFSDERIACPDFTGSYLSFDGSDLYLSQWYNHRILKLDAAGKILREIAVGAEISGHVFI